MHRAIIPLICALGGCVLASCGASAHVATHTSPTFKAPAAQRALAFARAVNLTPADVPGFTPTAKHQHDSPREKALERQMLRCAGAAGPAKAIAEEGSKDFELKHAILDFSVSSEVSVQPDTARAEKASRRSAAPAPAGASRATSNSRSVHSGSRGRRSAP